MKHNSVIRVTAFSDSLTGAPALWLEQFRYMGFLRWHDQGTEVYKAVSGTERETHIRYVFDIFPPKGVNKQVWLKQNTERMQSFGINAVIAPALRG